MPQWIVRGPGLKQIEDRLTGLSKQGLEALQRRIEQERWWRFLRTGQYNDRFARHMREHWFNENDRGWWPHCHSEPVSRTASIPGAVTVRLLLPDMTKRR